MGMIVWLASYPKSGNTWLRALLHNLLQNPDQPYDINELSNMTYGDSQRRWYDLAQGGPTRDLDDEAINRLRPAAHRLMTEHFPDSVFVKTHNYLGTAAGQPLITLDLTAATLYVVRNPLDVVLSAAPHYGLDIDAMITRMADSTAGAGRTDAFVPEYHRSWTDHVDSWTATDHPRLHVLRYEDLAAQPFRTFGAVAAFLGLKPPKERLQKAIRFASFKELRGQEQHKGFVERSSKSAMFFRKGEAGQWKKDLTPAQIDRIVKDHGAAMARFGYLP